MNRISVALFFLFIVFIFSCDDTQFKASKAVNEQETLNDDNKGSETVNEQETLNDDNDQEVLKIVSIECDKNQLEVSSTKSISGSSRTKAVVSGNICLKGKNTIMGRKINIIFVVDTSGSMKRADPTKEGSCNRKKAVEKVVNLMTKEASSSNINGTVVTFDTNATTVDWSNLSLVPTNGLCNNAGVNTNYEAAFEKVKELLVGKSGLNVVYFITDGAPEWWIGKNYGTYENDWNGGEKGGRRGIANLRAAVPNLLINTIYCVDPVATCQSPVNGFCKGSNGRDYPSKKHVYDYLLELMKDISRIKEADLELGSTIVDKITDFEETIPAGTFNSSDDVTATVTVGGSSKKLKIDSLNQVSEGVYKYSLEKVYLEGNPGSVVDNEFKVVGKGSDGSTSVSKVTVKFLQTN